MKDELNQLLQAEIDQEALDNKNESKKVKGFSPTGIKSLRYLGENLMQIQDAGGGADYLMAYLDFKRMTEIFPFKEKALELAFSNILNGNLVIINYDHYKVFIQKDLPIPNPLGEQLTDAKENYDELDPQYNPDYYDELEWHSLNNKI